MKAVRLGRCSGAALIFHVAGGLGGGFGAKQARDKVEAKVDSGGNAGRGTKFAVVVKTLGGIDDCSGCNCAELVEALVMCGGFEPVEQADFSEHKGAGADAGHDLDGTGLDSQPFEQCGLIQKFARAGTAGYDEHVGRGAIFQREFGKNLQTVDGANGGARGGYGMDAENRVTVEFIGDGEYFERSGKIEHLDIVKQKDGDIFLHGGGA